MQNLQEKRGSKWSNPVSLERILVEIGASLGAFERILIESVLESGPKRPHRAREQGWIRQPAAAIAAERIPAEGAPVAEDTPSWSSRRRRSRRSTRTGRSRSTMYR